VAERLEPATTRSILLEALEVAELAEARAKALQERMARNRAAHCASCPKAA
jgi:hypothetical protein